ncbi:GNAT family N-acetyltransferase [Oceanirhabdus sp. W0125-5]|uniref:GNAT family N-acetyltransferase n=1 Tax=Oceanirhabdus sp. W0125-5 TaxID=2999116 RepID=UPI0022F329DD|nr:GNAT family protein [Oceanirhabdus sp. W0125-5]WBW99231.1 GNAT family protein [Oceanirhabdus sp. W0125-5]
MSIEINMRVFEKFPVIEGESIKLNRITNEYIKELYYILSDPDVAEFDWFEPINTLEQAERFIKHYNDEFENKEEITWGIFNKIDGKLVGICCLGDFEESSRRCEIGYDIKKSEWNKGYGTEAVELLIEFALCEMNLNRVEAFITPGNDGSVRVLEKCGFIREGLVRERDFIKGELVDGIIMAILKSDYKVGGH